MELREEGNNDSHKYHKIVQCSCCFPNTLLTCLKILFQRFIMATYHMNPSNPSIKHPLHWSRWECFIYRNNFCGDKSQLKFNHCKCSVGSLILTRPDTLLGDLPLPLWPCGDPALPVATNSPWNLPPAFCFWQLLSCCESQLEACLHGKANTVA